jgi:hypothetical protein
VTTVTVRKVIIAPKHSLESPEGVLHSAYVKKIWFLPRDHVLLEFYHPAFEFTRDPSFVTQWSDSARLAAAEAVEKEKAIFSPLYKKVRKPSDALMLLVPSRTAMYEFVGPGKGRIRWPDLGCSPDWESSTHIRTVASLEHRSGDMHARMTALEGIFNEWLGAMSEFGLRITVSDSTVVGSHFSKSLEFNEPCGDSCMAFYMLVAITTARTGAVCLGFFHVDDYDSPFLQIGGSRRTEQVRLRG